MIIAHACSEIYLSWVAQCQVIIKNTNPFCIPVVQCDPLSEPANGGVAYKYTAVYFCDDGYELSGSTSGTLTCQSSGEWSDSQPTCEGISFIS